jgi:hypothetical protein
MTLTDKTTGDATLFITLEDITLEEIKNSANKMCKPSQHYVERVLTISFPIAGEEIQDLQDVTKDMMKVNREYEKLLEELSEEVDKALSMLAESGVLIGKDRELPKADYKQTLKKYDEGKIKFTRIFIPELGNLIIEPPKFTKDDYKHLT